MGADQAGEEGSTLLLRPSEVDPLQERTAEDRRGHRRHRPRLTGPVPAQRSLGGVQGSRRLLQVDDHAGGAAQFHRPTARDEEVAIGSRLHQHLAQLGQEGIQRPVVARRRGLLPQDRGETGPGQRAPSEGEGGEQDPAQGPGQGGLVDQVVALHRHAPGEVDSDQRANLSPTSAT